MEDIFDGIGEVLEPISDAAKDWCEDAIHILKEHAPQYAYMALKALKGIL